MDGHAEVIAVLDDGTVQIAFYTGPETSIERRVPQESLAHTVLPDQTRCYYRARSGYLGGRVVASVGEDRDRAYHVRFPNNRLELLHESAFHVRSYIGRSDPAATLASLAHETPFFFERRSAWLAHYSQQAAAWRGLTGLCSSKVEVFPHQVEVVRRVLQDPTVRYLLADEVGLGKTIEAGAILRQMRLDAPDLKICVLAPAILVPQWKHELSQRFGIDSGFDICSHDNMEACERERYDILVIDEAHRIVAAGEAARQSFAIACRLSAPTRTPHLLLLSATPVLHFERELLALLHLLDPIAHPLAALDNFRAKLEKRRELGQALLALGRASRPSFILRHVQRCAELIPDDITVKEIVQAVATAARADSEEAVRDQAARLRIHLTETYRLHRRMLRTRRTTLLEGGDFRQRRSEEQPEYEGDGDDLEAILRRLWQTVEEWRIHVAANTSAPDARVLTADTYVELCHTVASARSALGRFAATRRPRAVDAEEADLLNRIVGLGQQAGVRGRLDALERIVTLAKNEKWLVFCDRADTVDEVVQFLHGTIEGRVLSATLSSEPESLNVALQAFRQCAGRAILVADSVIEEGVNLQFADGIVLYDLPWSPMHLEQRIGRLDRLDRVRDVRIATVLSVDDPEIAFDTAWYTVLSTGFSLFAGTLADLQFLVEQERRRLAVVAFEGGPSALVAECAELHRRSQAEREAVAEQDVLDGLYTDEIRTSALWTAIEEAEAREDEFGSALLNYLKENVGLVVKDMSAEVEPGARPGRESPIAVSIHRRRDPLVPTALLVPFGSTFNAPLTACRKVAVRDLALEFVRPGHLLVDRTRLLADWDDRGQAFAMWRPTPGLREPVLVFRTGVRTGVDLTPVSHALVGLRWDAVSRGSLLRLIAGWLPTQLHEFFLDTDGQPAPSHLAARCRARYDVGQRDTNLGAERAHVLVTLTGEAAWPALCARAAASGLGYIHSDPEFVRTVAAARSSADEHFETLIARLRVHGRYAIEGEASSVRTLAEQDELRILVREVLSCPQVGVESLGVYVLAESPPWAS